MQMKQQILMNQQMQILDVLFHRHKYCVLKTEDNRFLCKKFLFKYITEIGKHSKLKASSNATCEYFNIGLKQIAKQATDIMKTSSKDRTPISKSEVRSILYSYRFVKISELYIMHYAIPYRIKYILDAIRKLSIKYYINPISFIPPKYLSVNPSYVTFSFHQQFQILQLLENNGELNDNKLANTYQAVLKHHGVHKIKQDFPTVGEDDNGIE